MDSKANHQEPTQLQAQFDKHFKQALANPVTSDTQFLGAWIKRRGGGALHGLDDLLRDLDANDPLRLMEDMKAIMRELGWLKPNVAARLPAQTGRWVTPMLLVLGERLLQQQHARQGDEVLHLRLDQATVASILGACILNRGLHLVPDVQSGALRALNVLCDMPALEYKFRNAAETARAELAAALEAWHDGGTPMQRKERLRRIEARGVGPRSPEALRIELEDLEREYGIRFSFAAPAIDAPAPLLDEAAREHLRGLGVETFFFGARLDESEGSDDAEALRSLAANLMHYVDAVVAPFVGDGDPGANDPRADEPAPRRAAGPSRSHIFISYSHDERDTGYKDELLTHLHTFDRSLIDVWVDTDIGAGKNWEKEIRAAMARARVGVLLVSASFLTSKFITTVEVPTLITRQQSDGMEIMPILIRDCTWKHVPWLEAMQIRLASDPLATNKNRDKALSDIADEIYRMCYPSP